MAFFRNEAIAEIQTLLKELQGEVGSVHLALKSNSQVEQNVSRLQGTLQQLIQGPSNVARVFVDTPMVGLGMPSVAALTADASPDPSTILLRYKPSDDIIQAISGATDHQQIRDSWPNHMMAECVSQQGSPNGRNPLARAIDALAKEYPDKPIVISSPEEGLGDAFAAIAQARSGKQVRVLIAETFYSVSRYGRYGNLPSTVSLMTAPKDWPSDSDFREEVDRRVTLVTAIVAAAERAREGIEVVQGQVDAELQHLEATGRYPRPGPRPEYRDEFWATANLILVSARQEANKSLNYPKTTDGEGDLLGRDRLVIAAEVTFAKENEGAPFVSYLVLDGDPAAPAGMTLSEDAQGYRPARWGKGWYGEPIGWSQSPAPPRVREAVCYSVGMAHVGLGTLRSYDALAAIIVTHFPDLTLRIVGSGPLVRCVTGRNMNDRGVQTVDENPEARPSTALQHGSIITGTGGGPSR